MVFDPACGSPVERAPRIRTYETLSGYPVRLCTGEERVTEMIFWSATNAEGTRLRIVPGTLSGRVYRQIETGYAPETGSNFMVIEVNFTDRRQFHCTLVKPSGGISPLEEATCDQIKPEPAASRPDAQRPGLSHPIAAIAVTAPPEVESGFFSLIRSGNKVEASPSFEIRGTGVARTELDIPVQARRLCITVGNQPFFEAGYCLNSADEINAAMVDDTVMMDLTEAIMAFKQTKDYACRLEGYEVFPEARDAATGRDPNHGQRVALYRDCMARA